GKILPDGAHDTNWIDADVIIESCILDGEDRVLHVCRNFVVFQRNTLFERELSNDCLTIVSINTGHDAGAISCKRGYLAGCLGIVELVSGDDPGESASRQGEQDYRRKPEASQDMFALGRRGVNDCLRCI